MIRLSSKIRVCHLLFITFIIFISTSVSAGDRKWLGSKVSIGIGLERLSYNEIEPDTDYDSDFSTYNIITCLEGLKRWDYIFCGIKGVIPISRGEENEEWTHLGRSYQRNDLEYGLTRIDGYIGYPLIRWFNPFLGLRWSKGKQERNNFIILGIPRPGTATETIIARYIMVGAKGDISWSPEWQFTYGIEYFFPTFNNVGNSALPGWEISDTDGYSLCLQGGFKYFYTKYLALCIEFMGGKVSWEGSAWKPCRGGSAKWPKNDTRYIGGTLSISFTF